MRSTGARNAVLALLAATAVVLFLVLSGTDDDDSPGSEERASTQPSPSPEQPAVETIRLSGGAPVGGVRVLEFSQGDQIRFRVVPEPGLEAIHVHGYEIEEQVTGRGPATVSLPAEITGGFEVEAHTQAGDFPIAELRVNP